MMDVTFLFLLMELLEITIVVLPIVLFIHFRRNIRQSRSKRYNKGYQKEEYEKYMNSSYYRLTGNSYESTTNDLGKYGEYLIYDYLRFYESIGGKFLFNLYIPKEGGETTELDVVLICKYGVFVFESKNFSGWIFGSENQEKWVQTLSDSRRSNTQKNYFYNPIIQNKNHIKHFRRLIGYTLPVYSVVVFSERCSLVGVNVNYSDVKIVNRQDVALALCDICNTHKTDYLSDDCINKIYNFLLSFVNVNNEIRNRHLIDVVKYNH